MASILGIGGYVPDRVVSNDDWAERLDTSDEWITARTGIRERRLVAPGESTLDLAARAALAALDDARLDPADVDEIIVATDTPELYLPDTASLLQHRLGCREIPAYDLGGSGCAGFVQALDVARSRVAFEEKSMLVVGVEVISRLISSHDRSTAVLFGDGAGAAVVGRHAGMAQVIDVVTHTDGSMAEILTLEVGGSRRPFGADALARGDHDRLVMNGPEVFRQAVRRMADVSVELLGRIGASAGDVALVIPHQANRRIIDAVGSRLGIDPARLYVNVDRFGNTGSASIPLALWEAHQGGRLAPGDLVLLTAFGAGFHWGAAALRVADA